MPVFMIGTQRSGSNMLRLMINQLGDLAAPHPPHIIDRLTPLLPVYGALADDNAFAMLVDDVCRLVECNPVPWAGVVLDRGQVAAGCRARSLVAVSGAVHDCLARQRGALDWCCKSLANVHHLPAIADYHPDARFIYLYRDGRAVALSFTRAVVGEKHFYHLAQIWHREQQLALRLRALVDPGRLFMIGYERLIAEPESSLRALCGFLGQAYRPAMLEFDRSDEARRTAAAGTMWGNVIQPVMQRDPFEFLGQVAASELRIFESVAGPSLDALGYRRLFVPPGAEQVFSPADLAAFVVENRRRQAAARASLGAEERARLEPQARLLAEIAGRTPA